jgi:hypothetical protein
MSSRFLGEPDAIWLNFANIRFYTPHFSFYPDRRDQAALAENLDFTALQLLLSIKS